MLTVRSFGLRLLWAAAIFVLVEGLVFRTSVYTPLLEPDSSAGLVQSLLSAEKRRPSAGLPEVLVIGDSRMGFRARAANEISAETGYQFSSIAMPGSNARVWYYMLRDVDPTRRRYAAILIGVEEYDDEDYEDIANREMDIRYVTPLLGWADVVPFARVVPHVAHALGGGAHRALQGLCLPRRFPGLPEEPQVPHEEAGVRAARGSRTALQPALERGRCHGSQRRLGEADDSVSGRLHRFAEADSEQRAAAGDDGADGQRGAYRRLWYGRIAELFRDSPTRLVFLHLPRGPVVRPYPVVYKTAAARELAARNPKVVLLPEHAFDTLEQTRFFGDPMHLNQRGSQEFTRMAAREVARALGR